MSLDIAINFLEEKDSGIAYSVRQDKYYAEKAPLKKFLGLSCAELDGDKIYEIVKVVSGKRKLVLNDGGGGIRTISAAEFFDDWIWGPKEKIEAYLANKKAKVLAGQIQAKMRASSQDEHEHGKGVPTRGLKGSPSGKGSSRKT